jgi:hypothetical protein
MFKESLVTIKSIAYDIADPKTATAVTTALKTLGTRWARPLASVWYVDTALSAEDVAARLEPLLQADDGLIVQGIKGEAGVSNTILRWTHAPSPVFANAAGPGQAIACQIIQWRGPRNKIQEAA